MGFEYVFVGGGLQTALAAFAIATLAPARRIAIVERARRLGGNHTWCFHAGDLSPAIASLVDPLVVKRWSGYDVAFPKLERTVEDAYACVTSARLDEVVTRTLERSPNAELLLGLGVTEIGPHAVTLEDGRRLAAEVVVDARGPESFHAADAVGYQKFVGLELLLARPTSRPRPLLIDARARQEDGFRFRYVLPFAEDRVLVEETFFSDDASLDAEKLRASILAYASDTGLDVASVLREESGVLPLPLHAEAPSMELPLRAGYLGGWFHPTTGYSFPCAARLAALLATTPPSELGARLPALIREHARQQRFASLLNRLLFRACAADDRVNVLERFYRLPPDTIRRFYAMETTLADRTRIICGRPPRGVSVTRAIGQGVFG